jgi:hypothetical protein
MRLPFASRLHFAVRDLGNTFDAYCLQDMVWANQFEPHRHPYSAFQLCGADPSDK